MGADMTHIMPIISKIFCYPSQAVLIVRKRPNLINGGGFVVMNSHQKVVFAVHGCGILGSEGQLILKDGDGEAILFIRKRGGMVQALSAHNRWKGYLVDYEGVGNSVFSVREPKTCLVRSPAIRVSLELKSPKKDWDFEVRGSFVERNCTINDRRGNVIAQVGVKKEPEEMMESKDLYHVVVKSGYDQAFVIGLIAVLDNIHGESTSC